MAQSNRVVCTRDNWVLVEGDRKTYNNPKKDAIYTVRETVYAANIDCYRLVEFPQNQLYDINDFRPVDECGEKVLEQIASECEQIQVPLTALFCMRLDLPVQLTQLK